MNKDVIKYLADKPNKLKAAEVYRNRQLLSRFGIEAAAQQAIDDPIAQRLDKIITGQDSSKSTPLLEELIKIRNILPLAVAHETPALRSKDSGARSSSSEESDSEGVIIPKGAAKEYKPNIIPMEIANVLNKQDSDSLVDLKKMDQVGTYKLGDTFYYIRGAELVQSGAKSSEAGTTAFKLTPGLTSLLTRKITNEYNEDDYSNYLDILQHSNASNAIMNKGRGRKTDKEIQMYKEL